MPFDNPANIGTRVVDNNPVTNDKTLSNAAAGTVVFDKVDMTDAQSFFLRVTNSQTNTNALCPSCVVTLTWWDIFGIFIVGQQTYQMNYGGAGNGQNYPAVSTYINDRCRGSLLTVTMTGNCSLSGADTGTSQEFTLISSTRPVDTPRYYDDSFLSTVSSGGSDGIVIDFQILLAGGGNTGYQPASLTSGPLSLVLSQGSAGTTSRLDLSWGNVPLPGGPQAGVFSYTVAAAAVSTLWISTNPPKHPLFWRLVNLSATVAATVNLHAWAN